MTIQGKQYGAGPRAAASCAVLRVAHGISTTDDPEEWVVQAGAIRAGLRMVSCCILPATSALRETDDTPLEWAGWWIRRLARSKSECGCTTDGGT